ncbi:MAG: hypothetical protein JXM72_10985 [Deltaproteobacteria bacterium]|nr:hypothetical protein [Deltaproteobacteria bacterium]
MPCKNLEGYLAAKEELLMEALLNNETNWNLISESDIKAKHYELLDQAMPDGYGVSTEWSIKRSGLAKSDRVISGSLAQNRPM